MRLYAAGIAAAAAAAAPPAPLWSVTLPEDQDHVLKRLYSAGALTVAVTEWDEGTSVAAYDAASGERAWCYPLPCGLAFLAGQNAGAAVRGDSLFVVTTEREMYALNATSGASLWHASLCPREGGCGTGQASVYSPSVSDDNTTLFIAHEGNGEYSDTDAGVQARSLKDGSLLWSWPPPPPGGKCNVSLAERSTCGAVTSEGDCTAAGCCWELAPGGCNVSLAERTSCGPPGGDQTSCAAAGGSCCWDADVPCWEFNHCCYQNKQPSCFRGVSAAALHSVVSGTASGGGAVYFASRDRQQPPATLPYAYHLRALDQQTGAERWSAAASLVLPPVIGGDGTMYAYERSAAGQAGSVVYLVARGADTGEQLWNTSVGDLEAGSNEYQNVPLVHGDLVVAARNHLAAYWRTNGSLAWRHMGPRNESLCNVSSTRKEPCSGGGSSEDSCEAAGCCWHAIERPCNVSDALRAQCAQDSVGQHDCEAEGCCWEDSPDRCDPQFGRGACSQDPQLPPEQCAAEGCCWQNASTGKCNVSVSQRAACGAAGGDAASCAAQGCCWDADVPCWEFNHCCYQAKPACFRARSPKCYRMPEPQCFRELEHKELWYSQLAAAGGRVLAAAFPENVYGSPRGGGTAPAEAVVALDAGTGALVAQYDGPAASAANASEWRDTSPYDTFAIVGGRLVTAFHGYSGSVQMEEKKCVLKAWALPAGR